MTRVKINFEEVRNQLTDFDRTVQDYKSNLNDFFKDINQYSSWEGEAANKYLNNINTEKVYYENYVQVLETFIETFSGVIDDLNTTALVAKK